MSAASPEPSLAGLSLSGSLSGTTYVPGASTVSDVAKLDGPFAFDFPSFTSFPPFYTLQPNLTTRARQLELWSSLILAYCAHHRLFKLSLSSPPSDLFQNLNIKRNLKPNDIRVVLDHMSQPSNGSQIEWLSSTIRGEPSTLCYVHWRSTSEWADAIYRWVEDTGQKGAVLTVYELREGEVVTGRDWKDIDEGLLRKILNILVKRGKAQVFGQEDNAGVKFF